MTDYQSLNSRSQHAWDQKAAFWDDLHGDEGNFFHRELVSPTVERLLHIQPDEQVLDIACGTGVLTRRLAELGAIVMGVDFSAALLERAQARGQRSGRPIRYQQADATNETTLVALGKFDAVVCTMALMDIADIRPLFRAVHQLLNPNGRFVFATAHPAFNSNNPIFYHEFEDRDGQAIETYGLKISAYLDVLPAKALGAVEETNPHYNYHRPLHELLGIAFEAGFVLDGLEEPRITSIEEGKRRLSWRQVPQIPPVLAGRLIRNQTKEQ